MFPTVFITSEMSPGGKKQKKYYYRVMLHPDGSTNNFKFPLESYSMDEGAAVGAWVLLEVGQQEGVRRSGRALTPNVRNAELSA